LSAVSWHVRLIVSLRKQIGPAYCPKPIVVYLQDSLDYSRVISTIVRVYRLDSYRSHLTSSKSNTSQYRRCSAGCATGMARTKWSRGSACDDAASALVEHAQRSNSSSGARQPTPCAGSVASLLGPTLSSQWRSHVLLLILVLHSCFVLLPSTQTATRAPQALRNNGQMGAAFQCQWAR
jgi:hypothetical protein